MKEAIQKFIVGLAGPTFGFAISISTTQSVLQVLSLVVGIVIGVLTGISIYLTIQRKVRRRYLEIKYNRIIDDKEEQTTTI